MLREIKQGLTVTFSLIIGILSITIASWGLISYWSSIPKRITYEIVDIKRTTRSHECDTPFVTILKDVRTESMEYRCGKLGRVYEIISIYNE